MKKSRSRTPRICERKIFVQKTLSSERGVDTVVHDLIHDGTEREIPRPSDPELQKEYYSGKKKRHTVKNAVITCLAGFILFASLTVEGKMHDKRIADECTLFPMLAIFSRIPDIRI